MTNILDKAQNNSTNQCQRCALYSNMAKANEGGVVTDALHKKMTLGSNDYLFQQGQLAMGIFCVEAGSLITLKESADTKQVINVIKPGQILGANAINSPNYQHSARGLTDAQVCFIPKPAVIQLMNQNIQFKLLLMKALCQEIGSAEQKSLSIIYKSGRQRVAALLLEVWRTAAQVKKNSIHFAPDAFAGVANVSLKNLLKILQEFDQKKWIRHDKTNLKVLETTSLENLL
ncbi:hypothetical protein BKI52_18515 [marine bacterium AO1-C]|nr:hypothetical protein BKI52_18515 [marine bacterium AO1-C]